MNGRELFGELKSVTGYRFADIAEEFGISRQFIDQSSNNHSMTYSNSNKYMAMKMAEKKIKELKDDICKIEEFILKVKGE